MKTKKKTTKIGVLGGGLWGATLAGHLARAGRPVWLWEFFPKLARNLQKSRRHPHIPNWRLRPSVRVTSDLAQACREAELILSVLPSAHVRGTFRRLRDILGKDASRVWVVNASKGVEPESLKTLGQVIAEELPAARGRILTLSGPSFAREVARGAPTALLLAGRRTKASERWRRLFDGRPLRVSFSDDRKGVELGGSLKNVLAIGCGIAAGLKAGANARAALMTQGLGEMSALMRACGGRPKTAFGLAGIGDLILTGTSAESRNFALGEALGSGKSLRRALQGIATVTEGVDSALSARRLARSKRLDCPLLEAVWRVLYKNAPPRAVLEALGF